MRRHASTAPAKSLSHAQELSKKRVCRNITMYLVEIQTYQTNRQHYFWNADFTIRCNQDIVSLCLRSESFELKVVQVADFLITLSIYFGIFFCIKSIQRSKYFQKIFVKLQTFFNCEQDGIFFCNKPYQQRAWTESFLSETRIEVFLFQKIYKRMQTFPNYRNFQFYDCLMWMAKYQTLFFFSSNAIW